MYLGGGWFIHSSGQGVTLLPLTNWYSETFAWARRPLREASLS
jgi:cell wall-associated NlpC family hydrolase